MSSKANMQLQPAICRPQYYINDPHEPGPQVHQVLPYRTLVSPIYIYSVDAIIDATGMHMDGMHICHQW